MNLACNIILLSIVIVINIDNALSRLTINNKEVHVPSRSTNPTETSKTPSDKHRGLSAVKNSSSRIGSLIDNKIWFNGKVIYTIPRNTIRYSTGEYVWVDNRPVVNIYTGEILVPEAELNRSETGRKATSNQAKSNTIAKQRFSRPTTQASWSKGGAVIGNKVWFDGKLIYTIPQNKSHYMNPPYLMVDNRRVVNVHTGEILVPEAELNRSETGKKATSNQAKSNTIAKQRFSRPTTQGSWSKGGAVIGNKVWFDGKLIYTIPQNKSHYMNPPYLMVDNRRVVNVHTGEILVPEAELNAPKTEKKAAKSKIIGEIPYATQDTIVSASNGKIKIDGKVILEDEDFKNRGKVEVYVKNGNMYFNGNVILRDDPKGTFKMFGNMSQRTNSGMYSFSVRFMDGYTVLSH